MAESATTILVACAKPSYTQEFLKAQDAWGSWVESLEIRRIPRGGGIRPHVSSIEACVRRSTRDMALSHNLVKDHLTSGRPKRARFAIP